MVKLPWLISRRKLLFNCLSEIFLIYFLNKFILYKYLIFTSNLDIFTLSFIPFWLIFSYVFGRYSFEELVLENNNYIIFCKLFLKSIFAILISIFFVFSVSYNINLNNYNHFDKAIFSYSILSSFAINFLQFPLVYRLIKITNKEENWIFLGSKELFFLIMDELKLSRKKN